MTGRTHLSCFSQGLYGVGGVLLLLLVLCLTGCRQRELCYDHSHVSPVAVEFDWSLAQDAEPETMVVWFFSAASKESYRFELTGSGTAVRSRFDAIIKLRPGTYHVLCHNGTTENNSEEGRSFEDYRIVTYKDAVLSPMNRGENAPLPDGTDNQPIRAQASTVYAHTLDGLVTVEPSSETETLIRFTPVEATSVYDVVITGVENLSADIEASAVITGLAEAWSPAYSRPTGAEVTIPFRLDNCGTDCLRGSLVTFGDNAPHGIRHNLRVYTSSKYFYDFDVTDAIHDAGDSRHIEINLHGIKLPVTDGGMSPGIDGWEDVEDIELKM